MQLGDQYVTIDSTAISKKDARTRHERRSVNRPRFHEGWRKTIAPGPQTLPTRGKVARIDIWIARTAALLEARSSLQVLTEHDWDALNRLKDPSSRYSAIAAKVLLRLGLSRATDQRTARSHWEFGKSANGKPVATNAAAVSFSVSHVEDAVAVAVSSHANVGLDIESVDQDVCDAVIAGFCDRDEYHAVSDLRPSQKTREAVRLWTLKEAYSKLTGLGHARDFKSMSFRLDPIDLRRKDDRERPVPAAQFDSFWFSMAKTLFHGALAFDHSGRRTNSTEIQIISLVGAHEDGRSSITQPIR
jgi:phosphopantetheinyl transferase